MRGRGRPTGRGVSDDEPRPTDEGPDWARRVVAVAVVVAAVLVAAAVSAVVLDARDRDAAPLGSTTTTVAVDLDAQHEAVAVDFVSAWRRWRELDVVVRSAFARERPDGERLESDMVVVQLGGDRVVSRLGGAEGYVDGDRVRCVPESDGSTRCDRTPSDRSAAERLAAELETWAEYLSGVPPYYRILRTDDGCFELVLTRALPAADFGNVATFCFDEASGALARTHIVYANGLIETTEAALIDLDVDPGLLAELQQAPAGG